jgi:hypothetical protein
MKRTLEEHEIFEYEYSSAFARYVRMFNLLDHNVGLCISFLVNRADPNASRPFLDRLTTHAKLEVLRELVNYRGPNADGEFTRDFDDWFKLATRSKAARNQYIHGLWDVVPHLERPIRFTPAQWVKDTSANNTEHMTMDEYLEMMGELNVVFDQFMRLRKKYGM